MTQEHWSKETVKRFQVTLESRAWETNFEGDIGLHVSQGRWACAKNSSRSPTKPQLILTNALQSTRRLNIYSIETDWHLILFPVELKNILMIWLQTTESKWKHVPIHNLPCKQENIPTCIKEKNLLLDPNYAHTHALIRDLGHTFLAVERGNKYQPCYWEQQP